MIEHVPTAATRAEDATLLAVVIVLTVACFVWLWVKGAPDDRD